MVSCENIIMINGVKFIDVTNQTVAGRVFNYEEAFAYTRGHLIATSDHNQSKPKEKKESGWKNDTKPWKKKYK